LLTWLTVTNKGKFPEVYISSHLKTSLGLYKVAADDLTCAGKTITGVSIVTGTNEAVRYVGASCIFTASSVVLSAFIHIYA